MKKIVILIVMLLIPLVYSIECQRITQVKDIPCDVITDWMPPLPCSNYNASIYNSSGDIVILKQYGDYIPYCNFTFNISKVGTYHYNSTILDGIITVEGEDDNMISVVIFFLMVVNAVVAFLPFKVTFTESKAGDYMVKRMFWIAAILLLWFNMTLIRQLSSDWGLGIDAFLSTYWWIFTLLVFAAIFITAYVMTVGSLRLFHEAKRRKRMGDYEEG